MKKILPLLFLLFLLARCSEPPAVSAAPGQKPEYDSLRLALEEMYDSDQDIRRRLSQQDTSAAYLIQKMVESDSLNQIMVNKILEDYGWLTEVTVGKKATDAIFFVVQHADVKMMERWFPTFKATVDRGEGDAAKAAMMEDRIRMYRHQKQIYGTQIHGQATPDGEGWEYLVWPIEDPANVNERRRALGYKQTVEEYAEQAGARYDPQEAMPPGKE